MMAIGFYSLHMQLVWLTLFAVGLLFMFSCVYVRLDFYLKQKVKKPAWMNIFPSLEKLHRNILYLFYFIFAVLTVLVFHGLVLANHAWDANWLLQPKTIASLSTWLYFFVMLMVRFWKGMRGIQFFIWLIVGCLFLCLSMYGAYAWK